MRETPSQFTFTGVVQMHKKSREGANSLLIFNFIILTILGQFAIFFRNNHFNTIFKKDSNVYQLVTDIGFAHKNMVWEKLDEVCSILLCPQFSYSLDYWRYPVL
jgi:hypothetical protein